MRYRHTRIIDSGHLQVEPSGRLVQSTKQWGEWGPSTGEPGDRWVPPEPDGDPLLAQPADPAKRLAQEVMNRLSGVPLLVPVADAPMRRVGKRQAGRRLDDRCWDEYPKPVTTLDRTLAR